MAVRKMYRVRVKTNNGDYEGSFTSPFPDRRLAEVINRLEGYLTLSDVTVTGTKEKHPFVIVNKTTIETVILISEKTLPATDVPEVEH